MIHLVGVVGVLVAELISNPNPNSNSNSNSNPKPNTNPNPNANPNSSLNLNANSNLRSIIFVRELTLILFKGSWRKLTLGLRVLTLGLFIF